MEMLRLFARPSEVFESFQRIGWNKVFLWVLISSVLYSIIRYTQLGSLLFFFSDLLSFLALVIYISLLHAPIYYLFLREYYNLEGILKGTLFLTFPFFMISVPNIVFVVLAYLLFYIGIFANVQKVFENKLEALIIVIFPAILIGTVVNQTIFMKTMLG